jgi:hypothetical protein
MRKKQLKRRLAPIQDELDEIQSLAFALMDTVKPNWGWHARFILEFGFTAADEDAMRAFRKWLHAQDHATVTGEAMIAAFDKRMPKPFKGKLEALFEAQVKDRWVRKRFLQLVRSAREKAT